MKGYILSILGIVIAGILIDIVIPGGKINKYIKSLYSIFVVAVVMNPIIKMLNNGSSISLKYADYEVNPTLLTHIYKMRATSLETNLEKSLTEEGFANVDIILNFSIENNQLKYNSCQINLKNVVIEADKQHINKYEFIKEVVKQNTNLTDEGIIFNE